MLHSCCQQVFTGKSLWSDRAAVPPGGHTALWQRMTPPRSPWGCSDPPVLQGAALAYFFHWGLHGWLGRQTLDRAWGVALVDLESKPARDASWGNKWSSTACCDSVEWVSLWHMWRFHVKCCSLIDMFWMLHCVKCFSLMCLLSPNGAVGPGPQAPSADLLWPRSSTSHTAGCCLLNPGVWAGSWNGEERVS